MWVRLIVFLFTISQICGHDRQITSKLNPGCSNCTASNVTLVYVRAEGTRDTVHQIWDFTKGKPTFICAITDLNTSINIMWEGTQPKSFNFSKTPKYSFSVVVNHIVEYNDLNDTGEVEPYSERRAYDTKHLRWNRTDLTLTGSEAMLNIKADGLKTKYGRRNGSIVFKLDLLPFTDYAAVLPHLVHSSNSTLIDISLVNITTSKDFNSSRFALDLLLVSTDRSNDNMRMKMRKSLDDEHTPGIFEIVEIRTPESFTSDDGGFLQFRPVAYTESERSVTSSTTLYAGKFNWTSLPMSSTVDHFYRDYSPESILVQNILMCFGGQGDGFYHKTNYTAWSFTLGYGVPPTEGFSLFVILVISIGLGIPVCLLITGAVYTVIRRRRQTLNAPERLRD